MPPIVWSGDFSVKVAELDAQHKSLVELANDLEESIGNKNKREVLKAALDRLLDYIAFHFGSEEALLQKYGYPEEKRHKKEHDEFSWKVLNMRGKWSIGEEVQITELHDFLSDWIKNHILFADKKYGQFLNSKGVH